MPTQTGSLDLRGVKQSYESVEVGGTNLLRGTMTQNTSLGNNRESVTETTDKLFGCTVFKSSNAWADIGFNFKTQLIDTGKVMAGDVLTYSIWAKCDDTTARTLFGIWIGKTSGGNYIGGTAQATLTSGWKQYSYTFTVTADMLTDYATQTRWECNTTCTSGKYIYWAAPKVERGNKATAWTPAPEDALDKSIPIYKRTNSNSAPAVPTSIITATTDQTTTGNWTKMHMSRIYASNTAYKYLWTCNQLISVGGYLLGHTDVVADNGTTVIDGDTVTTGTIAADRIAANSLALGKLTTDAQNTISNAATTATKYITYVDTTNGIRVYDGQSANQNVNFAQINSSGLQVYKGGTAATNKVADFGETTRIGKSTTSHVDVDYHSLQLTDKMGSTYFHVSDLRGTDGIAQITVTYTGDGSKNTFSISPDAMDTNYTVTVSDGSGAGMTKETTRVTFVTAPNNGSVITITYNTTSSEAKAYSLGLRRSNSNIGAMSFIEGWNTEASGDASHAEGSSTTASGSRAHAEGRLTTANGYVSHAEGADSIASGDMSHAEGDGTQANGYASHAGGSGTIAAGYSQTAIGKYNVEDTTSLFIVGNGTSTGSAYRSNAFKIDSTGDIYPRNKKMADFVIEQSTSGNWRWHKWNSGIVEAWYLGQNVTYSGTNTPIAFPHTLKKILCLTGNGILNGSALTPLTNLWCSTTCAYITFNATGTKLDNLSLYAVYTV